MSIPALRLVEEARKLCGIPWRHQGRTCRGVDCIGLVVIAARHAGLDLFAAVGIPPVNVYGRRPDPRLLAVMQAHCTPTTPEPGAVLLFQFRGESDPRHFAIVSERGTVIHAESRLRRQVIEHGYRGQWIGWTHSAWRLPGVLYP